MTLLAERTAEELLDSEYEQPRAQGVVHRTLWGRTDEPAWARPALVLLLASTAVAYLWALGDSGWANSFYSAAVQAGAKSWKAFFFGSSDASNFITVDKPPLSLWVMELSVRMFGLNSWSILAPQALEGVAAVGLLYATIRRWFSPGAALLAGFVMASTPVAVLMFRYNNPDSLLTLLLVVAAYATVKAVERAGTWWLVIAAAAVGTGFLTKLLQAFLVVPAIALVYLIAAPTPVSRRIKQLLVAGLALAVSSCWWVVAVQLTPATDRPYVGGSQDNSLLNLIFGYNGFGRLSGNEAGSVGGTGVAGARWGLGGLLRLFGSDMGGQVSWLLPAALLFLMVLLWQTRRAPSVDRTRASLLLFGGWLVVTGLVFSFARGVIHPYYTVVLAPAVGAVVGIGAVSVWHNRDRLWARATAAAALDASAVWAYLLLSRSANWLPWLKMAVLAGGVATALILALTKRFTLRSSVFVGVACLVVASAGPVAYALSTIDTPHSGAIPAAGPDSSAAGGFLNSSNPGKALVMMLENDANRYEWVAAVVYSNYAAGYQLATGDPVMAVGGFNGTDPAPTLAQFRRYVHQGKIHYFVAEAGVSTSARTSSASLITEWVEDHYRARAIGDISTYDLGFSAMARASTGST